MVPYSCTQNHDNSNNDIDGNDNENNSSKNDEYHGLQSQLQDETQSVVNNSIIITTDQTRNVIININSSAPMVIENNQQDLDTQDEKNEQDRQLQEYEQKMIKLLRQENINNSEYIYAYAIGEMIAYTFNTARWSNERLN